MAEFLLHIAVGVVILIAQPEVFQYPQQHEAEDHEKPGERNIDMIAHRVDKSRSESLA